MVSPFPCFLLPFAALGCILIILVQFYFTKQKRSKINYFDRNYFDFVRSGVFMRRLFSRIRINGRKRKIQKDKLFKRSISLVLIAAMLVCALNIVAFAQEAGYIPDPVSVPTDSLSDQDSAVPEATPSPSDPAESSSEPTEAPAEVSFSNSDASAMPEEALPSPATIEAPAPVEVADANVFTFGASSQKDVPLDASLVSIKINGSPASSPIVFKSGDMIELVYNWSVRGDVQINDGDISSIELWSGLPATPIPGSAALEGTDQNAVTKIIGGIAVDTTDGLAHITYNANAQTLLNLHGQIKVTTLVNYAVIPGTGGNPSFTIGDETFTYAYVPSNAGRGSAISKSASPGRYGADKLYWQIDVNTALAQNAPGLVTDQIPADSLPHTLDQSSVTVFELVPDAGKMNYIEGSEVVPDAVYLSADDKLVIDLGASISKAYRIKLQSKDVDWSGGDGSFKNEAAFNGSSASAVIDKNSAENSVFKKGIFSFNSDLSGVGDLIQWYAELNRSEASLSNWTIRDTFSNGQKLDENSFSLYKAKYNSSGQLVRESWNRIPVATLNFSTTENGFTFTLPNDGSPYILTYDTVITDYTDFANSNTPFTNIITQVDKSYTATVVPDYGTFAPKIEKSAGKIEADKFYWQINVFPSTYELTDLSITDRFNIHAGTTMTLDPDSFVVTVGGVSLAASEYTVAQTAAGFDITFHPQLDLKGKILSVNYATFYTQASDGSGGLLESDFHNTVSATYGGGTTITSLEATQTVGSKYTLSCIKTGFSYQQTATPNIYWYLSVNRNDSDLGANVLIQDVYGADQRLVPDSLQVLAKDASGLYNVRVTSGYTLRENDDKDGFSVLFDQMDQAYQIQYQTKPYGPVHREVYKNNATLHYSGDKVYTVPEAQVVFNPPGDAYISKGVSSDAGKPDMTWTLTLNEANLEVLNPSVTDTLSKGHILDIGSIKVYRGSLNSTPLSAGYALNIASGADNSTVLKISFDPSYRFDQVHYITYQSILDPTTADKINSGANYKVSNRAQFSGDGLLVSPSDGEQVVNKSTSSISGSADGISAKVTIKKVDAETNLPLAGAVFEIKHVSGSSSITTAPTNSGGEVTVGNLLFGEYTVREITPPSGYNLSANPERTIHVTSQSAADGLALTYADTKIGEAPIEVTLKKVDAVTKAPLAGAVFTVTAGETSFRTAPTGSNGIANLMLEPGTYTVAEAVAPSNYVLNTAPRSITVSKTTPPSDLILTFENQRRANWPYTLEIAKIDKANPSKKLAGAKFDVTKNGSKVGEITTDSNGLGRLIGLTEGSYVLIETSAPEGYEPLTNGIPVTLNIQAADTNSIVRLTVENAKKPAPTPAPESTPSPSPTPTPTSGPTNPPVPTPPLVITPTPAPTDAPTAGPTNDPPAIITPRPVPVNTPAPSPQPSATPTVVTPPLTIDPRVSPSPSPSAGNDNNTDGGAAGVIADDTNDPGTGGGNPPLSDDGQNIVLTSQPQNIAELFTDIADGKVPLGSLGLGNAWSLLNLIMSIIAVVCSILLFISLFRKKRRNEEDKTDAKEETLMRDEDVEQEEEHRSRLRSLKIIALLAGLIPGILFLILEDMRLPMTWITRWTPLIAVFFILAMLLVVLQFVIKKKNRQEDSIEEESADLIGNMPAGTQIS